MAWLREGITRMGSVHSAKPVTLFTSSCVKGNDKVLTFLKLRKTDLNIKFITFPMTSWKQASCLCGTQSDAQLMQSEHLRQLDRKPPAV